jgi:hypothetical protein
MPIIVVKFYFMRVEKRRRKKNFRPNCFFFFKFAFATDLSAACQQLATSFQSQKPDSDKVKKTTRN